MHIRHLIVVLALAVCAVPPAWSSGKKDPKASLSFHLETDPGENPRMVFEQLTAGKTRTFRRSPEVSARDVVSFTPFPAETGDYGVVFVLNGVAAKRIESLTGAAQGRFMVSQLNGRVVDGVLIDKPVEDGRMVIWKGVTVADIAVLDESFPRTGQEKKKKRK